MGVFIYHSNITYFYYKDHEWSGSHSHFLNILGNGSVIFFFMITGFLFWEMVLRKKGLGSIKHFVSQRIKRLVPMFLVSLFSIFIVAFFQSNYSLVEILNNLYNKMLFLLYIKNSNLSITGIENMSIINAGVFWTLVYEWKFYIVFPIVSLLFVRIFKMWKWFPVLAFLVLFIFLKDTIWLLFTLGMMLASLKHQFDIRLKSRFVPYILIFMIIGVMSYSIYLLHGILLWITFQAINKILPISNMNFEYYWLIISFLVIPLMIFSSLTFKHIENRFHHY